MLFKFPQGSDLCTVLVAFIKPNRWEKKMCGELTYTASALFSTTSLKWFRVLLEHCVSMWSHVKALWVLAKSIWWWHETGYNEHKWGQQRALRNEVELPENSKVTPRSFAEELKHLNHLVGMILKKNSTEPCPSQMFFWKQDSHLSKIVFIYCII